MRWRGEGAGEEGGLEVTHPKGNTTQTQTRQAFAVKDRQEWFWLSTQHWVAVKRRGGSKVEDFEGCCDGVKGTSKEGGICGRSFSHDEEEEGNVVEKLP